MGKRKTTEGGTTPIGPALKPTAPAHRKAAPIGSRDTIPGLGERVSARRKEMGLTLREAGARWGIRYQKLNLIESYSRRRTSSRNTSGGTSAPTLIKLALGGGLSTDYLCGLTSNPTPNWDLVHNAPPLPPPPRETPRAKPAKPKAKPAALRRR